MIKLLGDVLLLIGLAIIVVGFFMIAIVAGIFALGIAMIIVAVALADGKGLPWRS